MENINIKEPAFKKVIFKDGNDNIEERFPQEIIDFIYEIPAGTTPIVMNIWINSCCVEAVGYVNRHRFNALLNDMEKAPWKDCLQLVRKRNGTDITNKDAQMIYDLEFTNPIQNHLNCYRNLLNAWLNQDDSLEYLLRLEDCKNFRNDVLRVGEKGALQGNPQFSKFIIWLTEYEDLIKCLYARLEKEKRGG